MKKLKAPARRDLSSSAALWLVAALALIMALHVTHLPTWVSGLFALAAAWRAIIETRKLALPPRWLLVTLTIIVSAGVFVIGGTLLGREAGVALLAAMAALKLLEARNVRDGAVITSLGLLLLMAVLLYGQDLFTAAYVLVALLVLLVAQLAVHARTSMLAPGAALRLVSRMMLQAVPIMLILFVLFPRIPGPLWALPRDAHSGRTGLSDHMEPGSISDLIQSSEVAFRVRFAGAVPKPAQLYWRGPVLWRFDGRAWTGGTDREPATPPYKTIGERVDYFVTLEAHGMRSLFALDLPADARAVTDTFELKRAEPVNERLHYSMASYLQYQTPPLTPGERARYLALPETGNDRARALASSWREKHDDGALVQAALSMFRSETFFYTLHPPLLGANSVDDFLFNSRRGFCEHYASSFVFLMRAAGIPARVVTGYQGGETNGDYTIVRQSDAHAWAEVWLDKSGWTRVDPTAAVAPQRVEQGLFAATDEAKELPFLVRRGDSLWRSTALLWDRANNTWNQWVLAYGPERQKEFLSGFGFGQVDWQHMVIAMIAALTTVLVGALLFTQRRQRNNLDPVARAYQLFCDKLARRGLPRAAHEGPIDYTQRVARERPTIAAQILLIGELYAGLRYGSAQQPRERELYEQVKALNLLR